MEGIVYGTICDSDGSYEIRVKNLKQVLSQQCLKHSQTLLQNRKAASAVLFTGTWEVTGESEILPKSSSIFLAVAIQPSNKRRSKGVSSTDENHIRLIRHMYFDLSVNKISSKRFMWGLK